MSKAWRAKAHRVIYDMCHRSWLQQNTGRDGKLYKNHRQYSIPELAQELIECLGMHDQKLGEYRAKQIFCYEMARQNDG